MQSFTSAEIVDVWSQAPAEVIANFGDHGGFVRQHLLTPAFLRLLGTVAGKTILDAGGSQGYLCRMLARQGAVVTGVEPAAPWFKYASQREQQESLGVIYMQADLSTLDSLHSSFDAVIANMVFQAIPDYQLDANVANKGTEHARNVYVPAFLIVHATTM